MTPGAGRGPVLLDIQATQSASHRDRGVARYVSELGAALLRRHPALVHSLLLNPDLAPPGRVEPLVASGRLAYSDRADLGGAQALHVMSPFELDVPLERLWPARGMIRRLPLVVTLYDVIPALFPDRYLADPGLRARYLARVEMLRAAEAVLAISDATAADAVAQLQLREDRVVVVGAAASPQFVPPVSREGARAAARLALPGLRDGFVLYTSGLDDRKNFAGLFDAWSQLPAAIRKSRQLVMVCQADEPSRHHLRHLATGLGIGDELVLPGFVPDETLRLLYQATDLFVFPSLYEGFGLPVAEALACGAPTIGSNTSAVRELLVPAAQFDPADARDIAGAIERALTNAPTQVALAAQASRAAADWDVVADRTAKVYEDVLTRRRPVRDRRPLVAVVTPLRPARSGVADHTFELLGELRHHCDLHVFADGERWVEPVPGEARVPEGVATYPLRSFIDDERLRGGYDCVVYCVGNSEFHAGALAALRRRPGVVLAHEVRLTDLYALSIDEPGAVPGGFNCALREMYGERLPAEARNSGRLDTDAAERLGILMAREIVALSERFVVLSQYAAELVRTDIRPEDSERIVVVPFGNYAPVADATSASDRPPLVATFGVVNDVKQTALLVEALPALLEREPAARLAVVGRCGDDERARLEQLATALGVRGHLTVAANARVDDYRAWLDRAAVAVQLRRSSNGESSAAVSDCLAAGAAVVATGIGSGRELPDACVYKVDATVGAAELAEVIADLLADVERRSAMAAAARDFVAARSFADAATELFRRVIEPVVELRV